MRVPRLRTFREFAEGEIILPDGPNEGLRYDADFMAWNALLLEEYDRGRFHRFFGLGPAQAAKTLLFVVVPILYHIFEIGENVIMAGPTQEFVQTLYTDKVLPVIERTRYRNLIPTKGPGSRGGKTKVIRFRNGAVLRFMGAGGGDAQRVGHTARVVVATEIDKMQRPKNASVESSPMEQFEARTRAFGDRARVYAECVVSTKEGLIWQEVMEQGTAGQIYIRCPHCEVWILPMRKYLRGAGEAENQLEAADKAGYACQECGVLWGENDREKALTDPRIVYRNQKITDAGKVVGDIPPTFTFGLRWTAFHTPSEMNPMAVLAVDEFKAKDSESEEEEQALHQFVWADPWNPRMIAEDGLDASFIYRKTNAWPRGRVPESATKLTVGVDIGKYRHHWVAIAWSEGATGAIIDYGIRDVAKGSLSLEHSILASLNEFADEVLDHGWGKENGDVFVPDMELVDSGWQTEAVYNFCRARGKTRCKPAMGGGTNYSQKFRAVTRRTKDRMPGREYYQGRQRGGTWLLVFYGDFWKRFLSQRILTPYGEPGSLSLYRPDEHPMEHQAFAKQIVAEKEIEEYVPGQGTVLKWVSRHSQNHWLDATVMACVAADLVGIRIFSAEKVAAKKKKRSWSERRVDKRT